MRVLFVVVLTLLLSGCSNPHQILLADGSTVTRGEPIDLSHYDALGLQKVNSFPVFGASRIWPVDLHAFVVDIPDGQSLLIVGERTYVKRSREQSAGLNFHTVGDATRVVPGSGDRYSHGSPGIGGRRYFIHAAYLMEWKGARNDVIARLRNGEDIDIRVSPTSNGP